MKQKIIIKQNDGREDLMLRCDNCGRKLKGIRYLHCIFCEPIPKKKDRNKR